MEDEEKFFSVRRCDSTLFYIPCAVFPCNGIHPEWVGGGGDTYIIQNLFHNKIKLCGKDRRWTKLCEGRRWTPPFGIKKIFSFLFVGFPYSDRIL